MIYYDIRKSSFGNVLIAHTDKGICAILFGTWDLDEELDKIFPEQPLQNVYSPQYALKIVKQLENNIDLDKIPIDIHCGTPFQQLVWENLRKIKNGTTITYSGLAAKIGLPKTVRAVASACGVNPISILIPCHRVVPKAGGIGKYRWGTEMKQKLLDRESI